MLQPLAHNNSWQKHLQNGKKLNLIKYSLWKRPVVRETEKIELFIHINEVELIS